MTQQRLTRHAIVRKTLHVGISTMASKAIGFFREVMVARVLGVGGISDAYFAAFRLPSSLRKIFAEGALNAAFVPALVGIVKNNGKEQASRTVTAIFLVLQAFLVMGCIFLAFHAQTVVSLMVPGWGCAEGTARCLMTIRLFKILIFFIALASAAALFNGALQTVHSFTVPVYGQILMNCLLVGELFILDRWSLPVTVLAVAVLFNSMVFLAMSWWYYRHHGFSLALPNRQAWSSVWDVFKKFLPCVIGFGAGEVSLIIDQVFASYLPEGSYSLLRYTFAFTRVPLQVFATAFSTILLPHFSRVSSYAPRRLSFYLFESAKFVWWITLPATIFMAAFSYKIFYTLLLSPKFTLVHVQESSYLLAIFITGLFFFSFEKIVLTTYYALHETMLPTVITIGGTFLNTALNPFFMYLWGARGLVLATVVASVVKLIVLLEMLRRRFDFAFYYGAFWRFLVGSTMQMAMLSWLFVVLYNIGCWMIAQLPGRLPHIFLETVAFWIWVFPLAAALALCAYVTRRRFGIRLHFLD